MGYPSKSAFTLWKKSQQIYLILTVLYFSKILSGQRGKERSMRDEKRNYSRQRINILVKFMSDYKPLRIMYKTCTCIPARAIHGEYNSPRNLMIVKIVNSRGDFSQAVHDFIIRATRPFRFFFSLACVGDKKKSCGKIHKIKTCYFHC